MIANIFDIARKIHRCRPIKQHRMFATHKDGFKEGRSPPKTCESNFVHHDFIQFGKQHLRYKAIFPSVVSSQ